MPHRHASWIVVLLGLLVPISALPATPKQTSASSKRSVSNFDREIKPLLAKYCYDCHGDGMKKGGIALDEYSDAAARVDDIKTWEIVRQNVRTHVMPPPKKPQPTEAERMAIARWIESEVFKVDRGNPDPGRVTIRRLNRVEYNNTIRDLVGVDFHPADDFPADDSGYGFDNIGDVLSLPPVLLERYLAAADKIMSAAIVTRLSTNGPVKRFEAEVIGPIQPQALPEAHKRIFFQPVLPGKKMESAREIIGRFAKRAYRRPVAATEVDRLLKLFQMADADGESFESSIKLALKAVLVSPHFLFRGEIQPEPNNPASFHPVNEYALASRLSYFLWSSMPDDELFAQAERGTLRKNLEAQVRRMLKDPKSAALVENFAGQWLQTRNLKLATPDWETFPEYDKALREAMAKETDLFFEHIMREDCSVLEFLDADYSFINARLARHYGIANVEGDQFRRVSLKGTKRGGVLTHGSVLTITSNPTRTSPVKRGKWVLENILGSPPPPPPADVPDLNDGKEAVLSGSLRQRMEQHREKPMCASCHARMDPIGFGLENFNGIGGWREVDAKFPVDPAGTLVSGENFKGPAELKTILLERKKDEFIRCLSEKLLTYALGRGLEHYDLVAVDQITENVVKNKNRFSSVILGIVKSAPFQMRRGEQDKLTQAESRTKPPHTVVQD